ncbi:MAG TPA: ATP-binding protein [Candidatus Limnocylindrales bacterium]|nr:ATP-binding protein [Candidatus Limnocylindrales bacterium]
MTTELRDRLALLVAGLCIVASLVALAVGRVDVGIYLAQAGDRVVVTHVTEGSLAARDGVQAGMVVVDLNGTQLLALPQYVYPSEWPNPDEEPQPIGIEPAEPTPISIDDFALNELIHQPIALIGLIQPWDIEAGSVETGYAVNGYWYSHYFDGTSSVPLALGVLILGAGGWLLASGRAGASLRPLAIPAAVAVAAPLIVQPLEATWWVPAIGLAGVLSISAMLPLAHGLISLIREEYDRRLIGLAVVGFALAAAVLGFMPIGFASPDASGAVRWILAGAVPLLPGLAAAGPLTVGTNPGSSSGRLLESAEFAVAGATPMVAFATDGEPWIFPLALWLGAIFVAGRFTIRPLARLATRAQLQRDLVVAATEAERARVAADIHDDALQELTLLVRRLDAAGDTEGADLARTVSDRLRAICGDLRLPILDDLGVGPALDWLVLRIERLAGGEVRLERSDGTRPPADVELAFFRVAQEALSNAVKHGRPPIVVRYHATDHGASLSIDDAGPGIPEGAGDAAEKAGRFGLLNMAQRAEQIGAILDVRRWPGGGTHVALEWRPR